MPPESGTRTILLLRHGETQWNRERRVMGDADVALSATGRDQCLAVAELLRGFGVDSIVTSPLRRAAETADIVADRLGLPVEADARLVEVRFGDWQGLTYEEVASDPRYRAFARDPASVATPGGETARDVQERAFDAASATRDGSVTLLVTHGDLIRTVLCRFLGAPLEAYRRIRIDNCGLSRTRIVSSSFEVGFVNLLADPTRTERDTHWAGRT